MSDRTKINPGVPRFAITETVYVRVSAIKGYIEPVLIHSINYNPTINQYVYTLKQPFNDPVKFLPAVLTESEIITLCEALDLQISVLKLELSQMQQKQSTNCASFVEPISAGPIVKDDGRVQPPKPMFSFNEVVYLIESAKAVGRLEAFRVNGLRWENSVSQWVYTFDIQPRPERNTTVGDRDDMRRGFGIYYSEPELCHFCTAVNSAVQFLVRAVNLAEQRRVSLCASSS